MSHVVCTEVFNVLDSDECGQHCGPYKHSVQYNLIQLLLWGDILLIPSRNGNESVKLLKATKGKAEPFLNSAAAMKVLLEEQA